MKSFNFLYSSDSWFNVFLVNISLSLLLCLIFVLNSRGIDNDFYFVSAIIIQILLIFYWSYLLYRRFGVRLYLIEKDKDYYTIYYDHLFKRKDLQIKDISIEINKSPLVYFDKIKKGTIRYKLKLDKRIMSLESSLFDVIPLINFLNTNSCSVELSKSFKGNLKELKKNNHFQDYHVMIDEILKGKSQPKR